MFQKGRTPFFAAEFSTLLFLCYYDLEKFDVEKNLFILER